MFVLKLSMLVNLDFRSQLRALLGGSLELVLIWDNPMNEKTLEDFRKHTEDSYPKEACGFIIGVGKKERYFPANNIAEFAEEHFIIDPVSYADAEDIGAIIGVCHSHPNEGCEPSEADKVACETSNKPWHILSWPGDRLHSWEPSGYEAPIVGRQFSYGVLDCCTLLRDYYKKELNIDFKCHSGQDGWWDKGENRYLDNYKEQGFVQIKDEDDIQKYDIFLIKLVSPVPNHAAVFIGDDKILHHVHGRLSNRELYGGYWRKHTTHHLRHQSLC
jgi:proteasome lid subunit RPN8/RPN11